MLFFTYQLVSMTVTYRPLFNLDLVALVYRFSS